MGAKKYTHIEQETGKSLSELLPELFEQHGSMKEVAKQLGVTSGAISWWLKTHGLKLKTIVVRDHSGGMGAA